MLKHRMHAYSRCMWMNLRRMVIFQISTFQRSIFALFGPIREAFGSFKAIFRKIFTSGADCYVSLRMTTLVRLDSKYAFFKVGSVILFSISRYITQVFANAPLSLFLFIFLHRNHAFNG